MDNNIPHTDLSTTEEETIPYASPMQVGDIFAKTVSTSYAPDSDTTSIIVSGKSITKINYTSNKATVEKHTDHLIVPKALAPAAFNASQICNGNAIPPNETVYIRVKNVRDTEYIFIGLLPFTLPTTL